MAISTLRSKDMQEKECIMVLGVDRKICLSGSLFGITRHSLVMPDDPRMDFSIHTSHPWKIPIVNWMHAYSLVTFLKLSANSWNHILKIVQGKHPGTKSMDSLDIVQGQSPWTPWTFSKDILEIVHGPLFQYFSRMKSTDIVQGMCGLCGDGKGP